MSPDLSKDLEPSPQLPQEDGRVFDVLVCARCSRPLDGATGCLGTIDKRHPPSGGVVLRVVPASQAAALREQLRISQDGEEERISQIGRLESEVAALRDEVERLRKREAAAHQALDEHGAPTHDEGRRLSVAGRVDDLRLLYVRVVWRGCEREFRLQRERDEARAEVARLTARVEELEDERDDARVQRDRETSAARVLRQRLDEVRVEAVEQERRRLTGEYAVNVACREFARRWNGTNAGECMHNALAAVLEEEGF